MKNLIWPKNVSYHPDDLPGQGFRLVDELSHADLTPFLMKYLKLRGRFIKVWLVATAINVLLLTSLVTMLMLRGKAGFGTLAESVLPALLLLLLLIPLHEWLHALAYRCAGSKKVSYIINWKKLYVAALADRFVISRKPFYAIALAPFVIISSLLFIALLVCTNPFWQLAMATTLLLHTISCLGDFVMINYMQLRPEKEVVTYDDNEKGMSYFWVRD
ncbi:MAG TPA: DUF3267 domain-containing protein [Bacteroidales bacterium]|nr:DUF3267 domain-containing protein [Bacteroidales bacterium]